MRFVELVLTLPDDQIRIEFHERLTVLGGVPETERSMLLTSLLGAATGAAPQTELRVVDDQGRVLTWSARGAWYEDGTAAPSLVPDLLPDVAAVRAALVVSGADLGLAPGRPDRGVQTQLVAALDACTALELEMAGHGGDAAAADLRSELDSIGQRLVEAEDAVARNTHHEAASALAAARAELVMIEVLAGQADHDRAVIAAADEHRRLGRIEQEARKVVADTRASADVGRVLLHRPYDDDERSLVLADGDRSGFGDLSDVVQPWIDTSARVAVLETQLAAVETASDGTTIAPRRAAPGTRARGALTGTKVARSLPRWIGAWLTAAAALALVTVAPGVSLALLPVAIALAGWAILFPRKALPASEPAGRTQLDGVDSESHPAETKADVRTELAEARRARDRCRATMQQRILQLEHAASEAVTEARMAADAQVALLVEVGIEIGEDRPSESISRASKEALRRDGVRSAQRTADDVRADIERLEAEAASTWRPRWAGLSDPPPQAPDLAGLERRRQALEGRLRTVAERAQGLAHQLRTTREQVRTLETRLGGGGVDPAALVPRVLARLTESRDRVGGGRLDGGSRGEPFPVVLDDTFVRVPVDQRRELLEMLLRLGERIQVIYMTEDPVVVTWARQRSATGPLALLEFAPD